MYSVLVFLSCVFAASAIKCCMPPQWEGRTSFLTAVIHNGKASTTAGNTFMAYDGINHRMGQLVEETINGVEHSYAVLMDYNTVRGGRGGPSPIAPYNIQNLRYTLRGTTCYKDTLNRKPEDMSGCISDNATADSRPHPLYGAANNDMQVDWYSLNYTDVIAYVGVTADNCVPTFEITRGTLKGDRFLENVHYFNMSLGISQPDNLRSPPLGCENAVMVENTFTEGSFNPSMVGKRSVFNL